MIPPNSPAQGRASDSAARGGAAPVGWARRIHRSLGLALVPWVLAGSVTALIANHTGGIAAPCADAASAEQGAESAARRALGHLMVGASLEGEVVELVEGSAEWLAGPQPLAGERGDVDLPRWARIDRLAAFELPAGVAAPDGEARLAFQIDSLGARWQCALALDGVLEVAAAADADGAFGAVDGDTTEDVASLALVDLIAAAGLAWALSACVVLGRCPDRRRTDLVALLAGTWALAVFLTTL